MDEKSDTKEELDANNNLGSLNISFDDAYEFDTETGQYVQRRSNDDEVKTNFESNQYGSYKFDIEENTEEKSITTLKERKILDVQAIAKTSIRVSLKSFLISLTLSFLNLFV